MYRVGLMQGGQGGVSVKEGFIHPILLMNFPES
jgi:hypothetical protein